MKKIIAVAGAFALAACGGNADEAETETADTEEVDVNLPEIGEPVPVGTYTEVDTVGDAAVVDINGDGTYSIVSNGEQTEAGNWEQTERGVCMTMDVEGAQESCYQIGAPDGDGVRTITGDDGNSIRYSYQAD